MPKEFDVIAKQADIPQEYVKTVLNQSYLTVPQVADLVIATQNQINVWLTRGRLSLIYPFKSANSLGPKFVDKDVKLYDIINSKHGTRLKIKIEDKSYNDIIASYEKRFNAMRIQVGKEHGKNFRTLVMSDSAKAQIRKLLKTGFWTENKLLSAAWKAYMDPWHISNNFRHLSMEFCTREKKVDMFYSRPDPKKSERT